MKFKELELIITLKDYPSAGIKKGTRGTIVVAFTEPNEAYDVEFVDSYG